MRKSMIPEYGHPKFIRGDHLGKDFGHPFIAMVMYLEITYLGIYIALKGQNPKEGLTRFIGLRETENQSLRSSD